MVYLLSYHNMGCIELNKYYAGTAVKLVGLK